MLESLILEAWNHLSYTFVLLPDWVSLRSFLRPGVMLSCGGNLEEERTGDDA